MVNPVLQNVAESVRQMSPYQPGRPIEEVAAERGLKDVVKMASNENPLGAGAAALRALRELPPAAISHYPDGGGETLRRAIGERLAVSPECVIVGNGSNEVLELAAQLVLTENDAAVFSAYSFAVYGLAVAARRARAIVAPARDYEHDLEALAAAAAKPDVRLLFVANPNNPTGGWHSPDKIAAMIARVPPHVLVVLDEAYREYTDGEDRITVSGFPNVLVTRTFSKIHGLAGLRVGFGVADAEVIAMLNRIRQPFNVGAAAQTAAIAAIADRAHVARSVETNAAGMAQIGAALDEMKIPRLHSRANFITFNAGSAAAAAHIYEEMLNGGIIIRPLAGYKMPEWLRVSIGREEENCRFLRVLKSFRKSFSQ